MPNIASGDTNQDSTVLWTQSNHLGIVTFEYSTDSNFATIHGSINQTIIDPNIPVKVSLNGLKPGTQYYYRVTDSNNETSRGTFKTAAKTGRKNGLKFGVSGDWRGELSPYPAIANADESNLDFFVLHGDTIYADYPYNGVTWKFILVPEPIQNLGVLLASDRFEGYAAERTEILKFIDDNNINNVVFIAADVHGNLVNNLTYQLVPDGEQIATNAFEITTGPVAFDAPFGPSVVELASSLGLLNSQEVDFYHALPTQKAKDAFIRKLGDQQITAFGYDPLGLNNNLAPANGLIKAKLLKGEYVNTHTFGWTEFQIDKNTQKLTVTTYGIEPYKANQIVANSFILSQNPVIINQFEVTPHQKTELSISLGLLFIFAICSLGFLASIIVKNFSKKSSQT
ncbi:MAG TPA: hypothetical protein DCF68_09630 [Cyanothece sp. UBA12306]|nr:hypothetical protein [Cyanothece sp. UBA12306]